MWQAYLGFAKRNKMFCYVLRHPYSSSSASGVGLLQLWADSSLPKGTSPTTSVRCNRPPVASAALHLATPALVFPLSFCHLGHTGNGALKESWGPILTTWSARLNCPIIIFLITLPSKWLCCLKNLTFPHLLCLFWQNYFNTPFLVFQVTVGANS